MTGTRVVQRRLVVRVGDAASTNVAALYDLAPSRWASPLERHALPHPSVLPRTPVGAVVDVLTDATGRRWIRADGQDVGLGERLRGQGAVSSWAAVTKDPLVAHPLVDGDAAALRARRALGEHARPVAPRTWALSYAGGIVATFVVVGLAQLAQASPVARVSVGAALGLLLALVLVGLLVFAWRRTARGPGSSTTRPGEVWAWWSAGMSVAVEPWVTVVVDRRALSWPLAGDVTALHGAFAEDEPSTWDVVGRFRPGERPRLIRAGVEYRAADDARDDVDGPRRPGRLTWPEQL